jgi:hypothetical protein
MKHLAASRLSRDHLRCGCTPLYRCLGSSSRVEGKKVTIDLPGARVLDTTLNEEKTRLYVLQRGC